jgi:pyruvate,orthophosphate dikinase
MKKYVYFFNEGKGDMKSILGGKGAGLAEMTRISLPVPQGFTITTEVCVEYYKNDKEYPQGLEEQIEENLKKFIGFSSFRCTNFHARYDGYSSEFRIK